MLSRATGAAAVISALLLFSASAGGQEDRTDDPASQGRESAAEGREVEAQTAAADQPEDVGGSQLHAATQATRSIFLFDIYQVTLALPEQLDSLEAARRTEVPKAFRVDVLRGAASEDVPETWREELLPVLPQGDEAALREAYAGLIEGDSVVVEYAPTEGTTVYVNDRAIITDPGHELMGAFFDLWLGQQAVSDDLRQSMLEGLDFG